MVSKQILHKCQNEFFDITASLQYDKLAAFTYQNIRLKLPCNQVTCLLGKSGSGKSSLLKQLASLDRHSHHSMLTIKQGNKVLDKSDVVGNIAYMAQQDLLLPWLTVLDNVLLADDLKRPFFSKKTNQNSERKEKALSLLDRVGIKDKSNKRVSTLSGGMRQRVALARTLIQNKPIILMDEPFSSVDAITRNNLQALTSQLFKGKTVLLVTHDPLEALIMGHEILLLTHQLCSEKDDLKQLEKMPIPMSLPPREIGKDLTHYHGQLMQIMQERL